MNTYTKRRPKGMQDNFSSEEGGDVNWRQDLAFASGELHRALWREHPAILRRLTGKLHGRG